MTQWVPTIPEPSSSTVVAPAPMDNVRVIQLSNGNIVRAFATHDDAIGTSPGRDIVADILDPTGNIVRSEFQLSQRLAL